MFDTYFDIEGAMRTVFTFYARAKRQKEGFWTKPPVKPKSDLQKHAITVDYEIVQE